MADNFRIQTPDGPITNRARDLGSGIWGSMALVGAVERVYDSTTSLTLTGASLALPSIPATARFADVYCEGASSTDYGRYWETGTPTASVGKKLKDDVEITVCSLASFRAIIGTGTPILRIAYWHYAILAGE